MIEVESIKSFIRQNYSDIRGVEDIADRLDISYETLRKTFRRDASITLKRFLRLVRVEEMKEQLQETDKYCYEICYAVGYVNAETGEKVFKQITGMTMSKFRQKRLGGGGIISSYNLGNLYQNRQPKTSIKTS